MKIQNLLMLSLLTACLEPAVAQADDLFQISWKGKVYYTDTSGKVVSKSFTDKDVVQVIANNNGLDPKDLVLVYRPNAFDTAVVFRYTGQVVADYQQMPDITQPDQRTDVTSADGTQTARQSFLFDETHGIAPGQQIGSIFGTEKQKRDAEGNLIGESFRGTFQFAIPESGNPNWQQGVYSGNFSTGKRIVDTSGN